MLCPLVDVVVVVQITIVIWSRCEATLQCLSEYSRVNDVVPPYK
jgi:hypothetical protein